MRVKCKTCGKVYEDVNHWTCCPHEWFPISPSAKEALRKLGHTERDDDVERVVMLTND